MLPTRNYSATDTAITQRPTSTALLCIDSEDRYKDYPEARLSVAGAYNNDPYSFTISRNESIMNGFFTRVGLTEVVFPWSIPNVNTRTAKMFVGYQVAPAPPVPAVISLTPGFYTPSQLAAAVQTAVRALGGGVPLAGFTMTYGNNNNCLFSYATNVAGTTISFSSLPQNTNLASPFYYPYGGEAKQLFDLLGFSDQNTIFLPSGTGGPTFCQAIRYIDIVCEQLTYNQALKDTMSQPIARDTLCRLYITDPGSGQSTVAPSSSTFCPPGCAPMTIYRNFSQPKQIQWLPNQPIVGSLKFSVYDDTGSLLSISDPFVSAGVQKNNWSITLLITEN